MSQENVEIVREALEVWFGTDMQAVGAWAREHLAADFEAHALYLAQRPGRARTACRSCLGTRSRKRHPDQTAARDADHVRR
jgi:hypothetical protein